MSAIFLMNVKKRTKIALGKNQKFEIAITWSDIVQMSSSFAYMAKIFKSFNFVYSALLKKTKIVYLKLCLLIPYPLSADSVAFLSC